MTKKQIYSLIIVVLSLAYLLIEAQGEGDLVIYLQAAGRFSAGTDLYMMKYIDFQYQYYYSVLFAYILQPFYHLSYYWVKFFWLLINFSLFAHLVVLFYRSDFLQALPEKKRNWLLVISLLFSLRFVHENIHASQITILIFWCCVMALRYSFLQKPLAAATVLAIGINLKLLPLLLVPYLLYRGYFKTIIYTVFVLLGLYLLPSLLIGHAYNMQLIQSWWSQVNPTQVRHVLDVDERSFHGLSTLLATLLVEKAPDYYALPLKRNILDLPYETVANTLLFVRLSLLALCLYFVRARPFKKATSTWQYVCETSYLLLLIPLLFPHQQHYAFLFSVPAFVCVLYTLFAVDTTISKTQQQVLIVLLSLVYITANLKLLLGAFNRYYEHYKILTYGALLLIPLLMLAFRWNNRQSQIEK